MAGHRRGEKFQAFIAALFIFPTHLMAASPDKESFFRRFGLEKTDASPACPPAEKSYLNHNYDLYVSTATSDRMRAWIEKRMTAHGRMRRLRREGSARAPQAGLSADAAFRWGEVY